jgi:hypothetical protein
MEGAYPVMDSKQSPICVWTVSNQLSRTSTSFRIFSRQPGETFMKKSTR